MIAPYLDASAIIYLVEGAAIAQGPVAQRIVAAEGDPAGRVLTSQLARLECRVKPLRAGDAALLAIYDAFFTRASRTPPPGRRPVQDLHAAREEMVSSATRLPLPLDGARTGLFDPHGL